MASKKQESDGTTRAPGRVLRGASSAPASGKPGTTASRKTLRSTQASYARRVENDDDDKGGSSGGSSPGKSKDSGAATSPASTDAPPASAANPAAARETPASAPAAPAGAVAGAVDSAPARPAEPAPAAPVAAAPASPAAPEVAPSAESSSPAVTPPPITEPDSEFVTLLPPRAITRTDPDSPAHPPGKVPRGDSRSFRRFHEDVQEFVLIYRYDSFLITRAGTVGKQGTWTIIEYPHVGAAANAYARKCSELTGAGYRDLR